MATLLLIVIYLAFTGLGLPDSLLGAAWPAMHPDLGVPLESAGFNSMIIAGGTILSSLASGAVLRRFGTGKVALISTALTAGALLGASFAPSFIWLLVFAVPLGLGAGSIDAGLNHYVATHYRSHHMSWLHCFWGVGATVGPIIIAGYIAQQGSWRRGFLMVSLIQFAIVAVLLFALPLWKRVHGGGEAPAGAGEPPKEAAPVKPMRIRGVKLALLSFLIYCAVEWTVALWGSSYLVGARGLPAATAARWISMYFLGITVGRFITGFITFKVSNAVLVRAGQTVAMAGAALLLLPLPAVVSLAGLLLIGIGFAPVFPCMLHETPARFGKDNSASIIGFQMAAAYIGGTFLPPLLGLIASHTTISIFPFFVLGYIVLMLLISERINLFMKGLKNQESSL